MGLVNDTLACTLLHRRVVVLATNRICRRATKPQVTDHFAGFSIIKCAERVRVRAMDGQFVAFEAVAVVQSQVVEVDVEVRQMVVYMMSQEASHNLGNKEPEKSSSPICENKNSIKYQLNHCVPNCCSR